MIINMKRISIMIVALVLLFATPVFATNEGSEGKNEKPAEQVLAENAPLKIDNVNVYPGMIKAYAYGYEPMIKDGKAIISLPLLKGTTIVKTSLTATLDLGSTENSPFVYANYQKQVTLEKLPINHYESEIKGYLVYFEIPLSNERVNGTYPVGVNIEYQTPEQSKAEQSFTVYVTITDGKESSESVTAQPKIIVSEYAVSTEKVVAGEPFDLRVTLLNTEKNMGTKNVVMTQSSETTDIISNSQSNTHFIGEIKPQQKQEVSLSLKTRLDAEPRPQKVKLTISYEDETNKAYTVTEEILVEIVQPIRLEFDDVNLPKTVNAGDSLPVSLQVFNMGKSTIYNVLASLDMPGAIPDGSAYLGNMESGKSATAEIYAFFGTLDMSESESDSDQKYGTSIGKISITYEDEYGKAYTEEVEVSTTIERPVFEPAFEPEVVEETEKASQWWVSIIILIGIGAIIFTTISYKRKINKLRREYGDEDI